MSKPSSAVPHGQTLLIEVIRDLVEAIPREGKHEEQRLRTGASERVSGIGRDVDCAAGSDRRRDFVDLHLPMAADDVVVFLGFVAMKHEFRARRELCNAGNETAACRAFAGYQELPANLAPGSERCVAPAFPIECGLVDNSRFRRIHGQSLPVVSVCG